MGVLSALTLQVSASNQRSAVVRSQLLHQRRQHSLDLHHVSVEPFVVRLSQHLEIPSEEQVVLELAHRSHSDVEEVDQFSYAASAASLGRCWPGSNWPIV